MGPIKFRGKLETSTLPRWFSLEVKQFVCEQNDPGSNLTGTHFNLLQF